MSINDPIGDFLTRIRNGQQARLKTITSPSSTVRADIAAVLKDEGYIADYAVASEGKKKTITVTLKYYQGKPVIEQILNWYMGEEHFDQPWQFGPAGPRYEVEVIGDPPIKAVYHGVHPTSIAEGLQRNPGIVSTAMHCVNSIPYVCAAPPGIRTYLDLPLVAGRAAPGLLRK